MEPIIAMMNAVFLAFVPSTMFTLDDDDARPEAFFSTDGPASSPAGQAGG